MQTSRMYGLTLLTLTLALVLAGCQIAVERNPDGSLAIETTLSAEAAQREIRLAIADPLVEDLLVDFRSGWIQVTGLRRRLQGDQVDEMRFRLDLGATDGVLTAEISDAWINDWPIDQDRVDLWNERVAARLSRAGNRNPDSRLEEAGVSPEGLHLRWRVETAQSRDS